MTKSAQGVGEVLDLLAEAVHSETCAGEERISVGGVLDSIRERSYGPFIFLLALVEISPIGGIPGVPTVLAFLILTAAVQLLAGREHIWVPGFIERRSFDGDGILALEKKVRPAARWLDRQTEERLTALVRTPAIKAAAVVIIVLCLCVPPLELVPFLSTLPMAAIALFGLAILTRDGLVMLIAFGSVFAVAGGIIWLL